MTCFEDTEFCDEILPAESKRSLFTEFFSRISSLNPNIQYDYIEYTDIKQWEQLHYKTDHHWNVYGYTEGYRLITEMFKKNYPDIEPLVPTIHTFDDNVKLFGSSSLAILIPVGTSKRPCASIRRSTSLPTASLTAATQRRALSSS